MPTLSALLPMPRLVALDANGNPMPGALLYTYAAGTATPLATYSDSALLVQNANPVVADSGGLFGAIFLSLAAYKIDLQTAAGVSYYTQDNVYPYGTIPVVATNTTAGTQNNVTSPSMIAPTIIIRFSNASLTTITGVVAGFDGQRMVLENFGSSQVDLAHENGSSTSTNRLNNLATSASMSLAPRGRAEYVYDLTTARWTMLTHDQGDWITPTFAAGNYTGNASMTWTLAAGDVTLQAYWLKGTTIVIRFELVTTSVGGTPNVALQIGGTAWGGFASAANAWVHYSRSDNGGTNGMAAAAAVSTNLQLFNDFVGGAAWTAATNTTAMKGTVQFEVT